jgi:hypothetical protein
MVKEYLLTYRHINGKLIRKQLTELDLSEVYESPFVEKVIALTPIDFNNFHKSLEEHQKKEQKYIMETPKP